MRFLWLVVTATLLSSCSAQWHLKRAIAKDPSLKRDTIVKIDTTTGAILGEYWSSPDRRGRNPSRTTVDANGNVWAGNRNEAAGGQGSVVHVGLEENGQCVDRNGNGTIDTSTGLGDIKPWTNLGGADDNGGVSTAADECIIKADYE